MAKHMKRKAITVTLAFAFALGLAQSAKGADAAENSPAAAKPEAAKLNQEELEAKFKATLTDATMTGRWCSINKDKLGPEKEDKYTIVSVSKLQGDSWVLRARIQYR